MSAVRTHISEARAEQIADRMVQRRLYRDRAYIHAENAEAQQAAEEAVAATVWRDIESRYVID
jgi:hypothetical protein